MDSVTLSSIAGSVISLSFSYLPYLREWYDALDGHNKAFFMLIVLALTSIGMYLVNCYGFYSFGISCNKDGVLELVRLFIATLVANQGTYLIAKKL